MIDGSFPCAKYFSSFLANNYQAIFRKQVIAIIMTVKNTLQAPLKATFVTAPFIREF